MKQWPYEALLEGWYSFTEVPPRFELDVPSYLQRIDPKLAPHHYFEQTEPRNRLPRAATPEFANQTPDAEGWEVGYMDGCALDVAFLGRIRTCDPLVPKPGMADNAGVPEGAWGAIRA